MIPTTDRTITASKNIPWQDRSKRLFDCVLAVQPSYFEIDDRFLYRLSCTSKMLNELVVKFASQSISYQYNQRLDSISARPISDASIKFIKWLYVEGRHTSLKAVRITFIRKCSELCVRLNQFEDEDIYHLKTHKINDKTMEWAKPIKVWDKLMDEVRTSTDTALMQSLKPLKEWPSLAIKLLSSGKIDQAVKMHKTFAMERQTLEMGVKHYEVCALLNASYLDENEKRLIVEDIFEPLFTEWLQNPQGYEKIEAACMLASADFKETLHKFFDRKFDWLLAHKNFAKADKIAAKVCADGLLNAKKHAYYTAKTLLHKHFAGLVKRQKAREAIAQVLNQNDRYAFLAELYIFENQPKKAEMCAKGITGDHQLQERALQKILDYYTLLDDFEAMLDRPAFNPFHGRIMSGFISHRIAEGQILRAIDEMSKMGYRNDQLAEELFNRAIDKLDFQYASKAVFLASSKEVEKRLESNFKAELLEYNKISAD